MRQYLEMEIQKYIGKKYGKLTVIDVIGNGEWLCLCDCGNQKVVAKYNVINGHTRSCGCLRSELARQRREDKEKDKDKINKRFVLYSSWLNIKFKCKNPKSRSYKNYGAKGVTICKEWDESYDVFRQWCFDNGWTKGSVISLIDKKGAFEPNNVNFKKMKDLQYTLEYNGETKTLVDWAKHYNISESVLYSRRKRGLTVEQILFGKNLKISYINLTHDGITLPIAEWAKKVDLPLILIRRRLYDGWGVKEALETPLLKGAQKKDHRVLKITHKGESKTMDEWSKISNVPPKLIYTRFFITKWDAQSSIFKPVNEKRDREKIEAYMQTLDVGENIDYNAIYNRLNHGWTLEEAITTPKKRSRNSLLLKKLTCRGETKTIDEWSKISNIGANVISCRAFILKWTDTEKIIFEPINKVRIIDKEFTCRGETKTLEQWAEDRMLTLIVIKNRLWKKWTLEEALFTPYCCSRINYINKNITED